MIRISAISKRFGARLALDDVSFIAPSGAITGLVGRNGAGKSTLLRIIAGTTRADNGAVLIDGEPYEDAVVPARALGVFLSAELMPGHLTGLSLIRYACETQGLASQRPRELLHLVGLTDAADRRVAQYSLGMRQRLGLAIALVADPRSVVLDEPVNGLDPDGIIWLRTTLTRLASEGVAVLLSSHHMAELAMVADHIVLLERGRVIRSGPMRDFATEGPRQVYVASARLTELVEKPSLAGFEVKPHGDGAVVTGAAPEEIGNVAFRHGPGLSELRVLERTLEDAYFSSLEPEPEMSRSEGSRR